MDRNFASLFKQTPAGFYCEAGEFYVDAWRPVDRVLITHAHGDHARPECGHYLTAQPGAALLRIRLGSEADVRGVPYGERIRMGDCEVSFHPAGHILGSAQVRIASRGRVVVISGDYKLDPDPTCDPFEQLSCHLFVTEATFGLPIYRWPARGAAADINAWWQGNVHAGRTSIMYGYSLGKAQRLLAGLDPQIGPLGAHGAVLPFVRAYREAGVALPSPVHANPETAKSLRGRGLIIGPPSAMGTRWAAKFGPSESAMASGWMQIRGARRRRNLDRGFVLSDHADWNQLLQVIRATGAEHVGVTHGYTAALAHWLQETGLSARPLASAFGDDEAGDTPTDASRAATAERAEDEPHFRREVDVADESEPGDSPESISQ